ncbi:MAG: tRNA (adenosine(37)-N6)-dimethylallyltransferase MiaA [Clostridia bacterium]|nr:tRNA (adenosine(37)-N6)-dimethylallyltransferase MiaA [Clostridia bacterium]
MTKPKLIAVAGPTASGKSALALELCRRFDGELVSCDSMQIYRRMDIGTAKPTAEEMREIPHHLIDIVEPGESFSCADWCEMAKTAIADITARGKFPIVCGGTGLYLDNLITGNTFAEIKCDEAYREEMLTLSSEKLIEMLRRVDPESAAAIHPNNRKRVVRALEIYHATGVPKSEWDRQSRTSEPPYDALVLGLRYADRSVLYRRIDRRVDEMLRLGLIEEVRALSDSYSSTSCQAIGYKELFDYLDGSSTLEEAAEKIKQATRNYAKRQMTWFNSKSYITWIDVSERTTFKDIVNNAVSLLTDSQVCVIID